MALELETASYLRDQSPQAAVRAHKAGAQGGDAVQRQPVLSISDGSARALATADAVFDSYDCPDFMTSVEKAEGSRKECIVTVTRNFTQKDGTRPPFGPAISYLWAGDLGFWQEIIGKCPQGYSREYVPGKRIICTMQIDFLELPPLRRIIPVWKHDIVEDRGDVLTMGFAIERQSDPLACPSTFSNHKAMCEPKSPNLNEVSTKFAPDSVDEFKRVVLQAAGGPGGHVVMTIASYEYAEGALIWYYFMQAKSVGGCVVVSMDYGSYTYLTNRGVPTVLVPTISHLNPCCLFRFKMVGWRATNDVKVRSIIQSLEAGVSVMFLDMDVDIRGPARNMEYLRKYDLVFTGSYSFMYTYSSPTPTMIKMWKAVLAEVMVGGWDQDQFRYFGKKMADNINSFVMPPSYVPRAQNSFSRVLVGRLSHLSNEAGLKSLSESPLLKERLPIHSVEQSNSVAIWESMLNTYPTMESAFVSWHSSTECVSHTYERGDVNYWTVRQNCLHSLLRFAMATGRYAVVPDRIKAIYDLTQVTNWFPVVTEFKLGVVLHGNVSTEHADVRVRHNDPESEAKITSSLRNPALPWVELRGSPEDMAEFAKQHYPLPPHIEQQLELFVMPSPPDRLQFSCMRKGGPASIANPDPTCGPHAIRKPDV